MTRLQSAGTKRVKRRTLGELRNKLLYCLQCFKKETNVTKTRDKSTENLDINTSFVHSNPCRVLWHLYTTQHSICIHLQVTQLEGTFFSEWFYNCASRTLFLVEISQLGGQTEHRSPHPRKEAKQERPLTPQVLTDVAFRNTRACYVASRSSSHTSKNRFWDFWFCVALGFWFRPRIGHSSLWINGDQCFNSHIYTYNTCL